MLNVLWSRRSTITRLALSLSALAAGGCGPTPICGSAPSRAIVGFVVTTTTGSDSTNANIYFCVMRKSSSAEECLILDELTADDFEAHEVNTFTPDPKTPIPPGDLQGFVIRNKGGGFLDNSWEMAALRVEAVLDNGSRLPIYEVTGSIDLSTGDSHDSSQCTYTLT